MDNLIKFPGELHSPATEVNSFKSELLEKLEQLKKNSKSTTKAKAPTKSTKKVIKKVIQTEVDTYIKMDAEYKALEKQLKALRESIEPYMVDNNIDVIMGSDKGRIERVPINRAIVNARYTSYDAETVLSVIDTKFVSQVIVKAVDREALEFLIKTGKVPREIEECKLVNSSMNFSAKQV